MQTKFNFIFTFYYWFSILKKFHCTIFQFLTHFGIWLGRGWMGYNRHSSPLSSRKLILDGFSFPFKWIGYYIYVPYKISRWYFYNNIVVILHTKKYIQPIMVHHQQILKYSSSNETKIVVYTDTQIFWVLTRTDTVSLFYECFQAHPYPYYHRK